MRIDSCRKCGTELKIKQNCPVCTKPVKFLCKNCLFETDEQIHLMCGLTGMNYAHPTCEEASPFGLRGALLPTRNTGSHTP
ncbi:MAG: hypothetical protein KC444_09150 [Nitrosopumilus sp.]|nr:hypothetical protein [Nitrosopumilus sp.]